MERGSRATWTTPQMLQVVSAADRRGAQIFAQDLGDELGRRGVAVRSVALAPAASGRDIPFEIIGRHDWSPLAVARLAVAASRAGSVVAHGSRAVPAAAAATAGRGGFIYRNIGDPRYWGVTAARRARVRLYLRAAHHVVALWDGAA